MTSYGKNITIRLYGGSHDAEIGVLVEGLPAGIKYEPAALTSFLLRRSPGHSSVSTARREADEPVFLSGLSENGFTDGTLFHAVIRNTDQHSSDYPADSFLPRPSHADYPAYVKSVGKADLRGGGHYSGRLTAPLCIIGGILLTELKKRGISIGAHIRSIGPVEDIRFNPLTVSVNDFETVLNNDLPVLNPLVSESMVNVIMSAKTDGDSVGGIIECAAIGLPVGLGEAFFNGLESRIASIVFSIPAVKGVEFGDGFSSSLLRGSENNDAYITDGQKVTTRTNHAGGICGGMSTGMPLIFSAAFKPTPSIAQEQDTVSLPSLKPAKLSICGRHDPCIVPRAVPVIEAAAAIAIFDSMLDKDEWEA